MIARKPPRTSPARHEYMENARRLASPGTASDEAEANDALAAIRALPGAYRETLMLDSWRTDGSEIAERTA